MGKPYFEYFNTQRIPVEKWYWRLKDGNNKIIAVGAEPFSSKLSVQRAIRNVCTTVPIADTMYDRTQVQSGMSKF